MFLEESLYGCTAANERDEVDKNRLYSVHPMPLFSRNAGLVRELFPALRASHDLIQLSASRQRAMYDVLLASTMAHLVFDEVKGKRKESEG